MERSTEQEVLLFNDKTTFSFISLLFVFASLIINSLKTNMAVIIKKFIISIALVVLAVTNSSAKNLHGQIPEDNNIDEMI